LRYRKSLRSSWLAAWLALLAGPAAFAGTGVWTPIGPAIGGSVFSLAVDPDHPRTLYAAPQAGLYRSTDGGSSWISTFTPSETLAGFSTIAFGTDGALYGGNGDAAWRSVDGGATWKNLTPVGGILPAAQLAFDPRDPRTIYVAAYGFGAFRSTDGGATWNALNQGLEPPPPAQQRFVDTIALSPRRHGLLLAGTDEGIFRSVDDGTSWQRVAASCNGAALLFDPLRPARVYAACVYNGPPTRNGVMISLDSGLSWRPAGSGLPDQPVYSLATIPGAPRAILAGTFTGVFRSTDAGGHWTPAASVTTPSGAPAAVLALAFLSTPAPVLYAGTYLGGLSRSGDLGASWTLLGRGLPGAAVNVVASDPAGAGRLYAATSDGILRTRSGGASWVPVDHGLSDLVIPTLAVAATAPPTLYALGFGDDLFVSTNAGRRWTRSPLPAGRHELAGFAVDPEQPEHVLLSSDSSLFQSRDGGVTWDTGTTVIPENDSLLLSVAVAPSAPATIYAGGKLAVLIPFLSTPEAWKSTDGGATWSAIGFVDGLVSALAVDPADASTVYACGGVYLARSADGGATWTETAAGGAAVATAAQLPGFVAAGGAAVPHPVAVSLDRGATWSPLDNGLTSNVVVHSLAVDPASTPSQVTLYAGTETGVFAITFAPQALAARDTEGR
jgi:photosystem II stability/assembly factor-like uncharacterized protein